MLILPLNTGFRGGNRSARLIPPPRLVVTAGDSKLNLGLPEYIYKGGPALHGQGRRSILTRGPALYGPGRRCSQGGQHSTVRSAAPHILHSFCDIYTAAHVRQ